MRIMHLSAVIETADTLSGQAIPPHPQFIQRVSQ